MQETYSDWTLVSLSPFGTPTIIIVALLVCLALGLVISSYRKAKGKKLLIATRVFGLALILGFFTEPALELRVARKIQSRLAIVIDRSLSMSLGDQDGRSRYDAVRAWLSHDPEGLAKLGQAHAIDWYDLDGLVPRAKLESPPTGAESQLLQAIENTTQGSSAKPLAGIVLVSDGADSGSLQGTEERLANLGVPINTIGPAKSEFRDLAIIEVRADELAFVHNTFEVEVTVAATGFTGITLPLTLERDGQPVTTQNVALSHDGETRVTFKSKPDEIGEFVYTVSLPLLAGEAIASNNMSAFVLTVIRDKIRVLHVAGRPSWDVRFLRQLLKENPNVDLISFFILRTPTNSAAAPESELSLIPFPVDKLFTTELASFDVVILQNFDYRPYRMAQYLANIRDAVQTTGLGLVMVGGNESFADGGYANTELADILPLSLAQGGMIFGAFTPILSEAGRSHPITDLAKNAGKNSEVWASLPPLPAINRTAGLTPGATSLLHTHTEHEPIIALGETKNGRVMAIATGELWRWRFSARRDGGGAERAYYRLWSNALRWLVKDPEHARVRVIPAARRLDIGATQKLELAVADHDYEPVKGASLRITLTHGEAGAVKRDERETTDAGRASLVYEELPAGAYRVRAEAYRGGKPLGEGQTVFVVDTESRELRQSTPRPELLRAIARTTSGRYFTVANAPWSALEVKDPGLIEIDRQRNIELWDNAIALVIGLALWALDFGLRRRKGYV